MKSRGFQHDLMKTSTEAWENEFNDLSLSISHHGFSELHQLDNFPIMLLNYNEQDNIEFPPRCSTPGISPDVAELKDMVKALLLEKKNQTQAPTPVKAVEESCVTCGFAHSYRNCPATDGNIFRDNIQEFVTQAATANFNQGNTGYRAPIANQIRPPIFPPVQQNQGNNQNRGNNYNQSQIYRPPINQPLVHQAQPYQAPLSEKE
ncbi:hypothetical protein Tco_0298512 [Tanacetum coccineum]